jgi:hypothetical protein
MRNFKTRLTKIKNLIQTKIPEGADVFGYQGVSRDLLLTTCLEIYELSNEIEAQEGNHHFEIIVLKRFEVEVYEKLKEFLENEVDTSRVKEKFDKFLNEFSKLYEKTKQVYFIVNKNGLKDDLELSNLRSQITALSAQKVEFEKLISELSPKAESATALSQTVTQALAEATAAITTQKTQTTADSAEIVAAKTAVMTWYTAISETFNKMAGWDKQVQETLAKATANQGTIEGHLKTLNDSLTALASATTKGETLTTQTAATHQKNLDLIHQIEEILGDANRVGMAGSFQDRMEDMALTQKKWRDIFIFVMIGFFLASLGIVAFHLITGNFTTFSLLSRLSILTPVVWLAWFSARQYGFANKVREDYAFKYSSAMAYEGYRKAVRETQNEDLEKILIEIAMYNMALNPIRLYDSRHSDHASPFAAFLEQVLDRVPGFKKIKVSTSGITGEAELTAPKA